MTVTRMCGGVCNWSTAGALRAGFRGTSMTTTLSVGDRKNWYRKHSCDQLSSMWILSNEIVVRVLRDILTFRINVSACLYSLWLAVKFRASVQSKMNYNRTNEVNISKLFHGKILYLISIFVKNKERPFTLCSPTLTRPTGSIYEYAPLVIVLFLKGFTFSRPSRS